MPLPPALAYLDADSWVALRELTVGDVGWPETLGCVNCGATISEGYAEVGGWEYWSDGLGVLRPFCEICAVAEFAPQAPASVPDEKRRDHERDDDDQAQKADSQQFAPIHKTRHRRVV